MSLFPLFSLLSISLGAPVVLSRLPVQSAIYLEAAHISGQPTEDLGGR